MGPKSTERGADLQRSASRLKSSGERLGRLSSARRSSIRRICSHFGRGRGIGGTREPPAKASPALLNFMTKNGTLARGIMKMAKPIDFAALVVRGLLTQEEDGWYRISDIHKLPRAARARIDCLQEIDGVLRRVKFAGEEDRRRALALARRIRGRAAHSCFAPEDINELLQRLRDIEDQLDRLAEFVLAANLRRGGVGQRFFSPRLALIGARDGWLRRVKEMLKHEAGSQD